MKTDSELDENIQTMLIHSRQAAMALLSQLQTAQRATDPEDRRVCLQDAMESLHRLNPWVPQLQILHHVRHFKQP